MQGVVISKRWIVTLTAVGLMSLLVALFSPAWSGVRGQVSAAGECGTPAENPSATTTLGKVVVLPAGSTLTSGATFQFTAFACSTDNIEITSGISSVTWGVTGGGSISSTGLFTAPSVTANTTVTIQATVVHSSTTTSGSTNATVTGATAAATPTPIPAFTGPTPVAPAKPAKVQVQEAVLPDKAVTVSATDPASGAKVADVTLPAGAVSSPAFIQIGGLSNDDVDAKTAIAALPSTLIRVGTKVFQINLVDSSGAKLSGALKLPARITVPYTDAEAAAVGGAINLQILRYDTQNKGWAALGTTVDYGAKTLNASVSDFSVFVLGGQSTAATGATATPTPAPTATPVPTPVLPSTGGVAPGNGLLLGMLATGLMLVLAGVAFARTRRRGNEA